MALLAAVPFGSLGALEQRVVDGRLTGTVPQGRFLISNCDDQSRASYQVAYLQRHAPGRPMVYMLGGSATRECFQTNDGLADAVSRRAGRRVRVRLMAGSSQRLPATLAIIDNLPPAKGGVILISVHHFTFVCGQGTVTGQLEGRGVLARSPALQAFVSRYLGLQLDNSIRPGLRSYLATYRDVRGVSAFRAPWIAYHPHRYGPGTVMPRWRKERAVRKWLQGKGRPGGEFERRFDLSAALLEECVRLAREKGFEVVLMEGPQDIAVVGDRFDRHKERYRPVCRSICSLHGAHYVNLNGRCGLKSGDFADLYHLVPTGRAKWAPKLADELSAVFRDHYEPAAASPSPSLSAAPTEAVDGLLGLLTSRLETTATGRPGT